MNWRHLKMSNHQGAEANEKSFIIAYNQSYSWVKARDIEEARSKVSEPEFKRRSLLHTGNKVVMTEDHSTILLSDLHAWLNQSPPVSLG